MIRTAVTVGEILEPLSYTFTNPDGLPLNLAGFSGTGVWEHSDGTTGVFSLTISTGTATGSLPEAALASSGVVDVRLWVGNGATLKFAGELWRFSVAAQSGVVPSV